MVEFNDVAGNEVIVGSIEFTNNEWIAFGAGTFTITYDALGAGELINNHTGSGAAQVGVWRFSFRLPDDFDSFPASAFQISTFRSGATNALTATLEEEGVADATINALDIRPTADVTFEDKSSDVGTVYSAGDILLLEITSTVDALESHSINKIKLDYNRTV